MKFAIESGQRQFFRKHRFLETSGLLSDVELKELNMHVDQALKARLKDKPLSQEIFEAGRDLSREDAFIKKIVLHNRFAEIASELIESRPLRFGYDQLLIPFKEKGDLNPYHPLSLAPIALKDISSLQGVLCGVLICLKKKLGAEGEAPSLDSSFFPAKAGNVTFFDAELLIDFNQLIENSENRYLMIVYTKKTAIYYVEERDPKGHHLKNLGYVFGDHLSDKLNPIVFR